MRRIDEQTRRAIDDAAEEIEEEGWEVNGRGLRTGVREPPACPAFTAWQAVRGHGIGRSIGHVPQTKQYSVLHRPREIRFNSMSSTPLALAMSPSRARSGLAWRVALVFVGSWLVAGLAQLEIRLPFTPVPITGQTLGVLLVGASLGSLLGGVSLALYLAQGAIGLPFFSGGESGVDLLRLSSVTGGYLWGFVLSAALVGWLSEHGWDRSVGSSIGAMFLGEVVIYLLGIPWLMSALDVPLGRALEIGLAPFVVGDTIKLLIAAGLLPLGWRFARNTQSRRGREHR